MTTEKNKITESLLPSLQGVMPSVIVTCSKEGVPNVSGVSQIYYVDEHHIAISNQFLNKTVKNIAENPLMSAIITCPVDFVMHKLLLSFVESQTSGETIDSMKLQLDVLASMQGMQNVFSLRSADIYEVLSIEAVN